MSMLNIRIDEEIKKQLKEIAILNGDTLSGVVIKAINEMLENEFDQKLALFAKSRRKPNSELKPISDLYDEYGL